MSKALRIAAERAARPRAFGRALGIAQGRMRPRAGSPGTTTGWRRGTMVATGLAVALGGSGCLGEAPAQTVRDPLTLGVQTHFSQGWNGVYLDLVRPARPTRSLRDGAPWAQVEKVAGQYDFNGPRIASLDRFCREGGTVLLTAAPLNPLYEGGKALREKASYDAFARYLVALGEHFGSCLVAIEIGNEINAPRTPQLGLDEPGRPDPLQRYVDLVATAHAAFRNRGSSVKILGGSTNLIATGFLEDLFSRGLLRAADGIAVHPYRLVPEGTDVELDNLQTAMRRHGKPLPIWATEFSDNFVNPDRAAGHLVKMASLLSASGVSRAYWYALIDQKWYPTMGLYRRDGSAKPAAAAFRLLRERVLPLGPAQAMTDAEVPARLYRFGTDAWIAWGSGTLHLSPGARVTDAQGRPMPGATVTLTDFPVVVTDSPEARYERGLLVADSLLGYGSPAWSYRVIKPGGGRVPLALLDGRWGSRFESRFFRPAFLDQVSGAPAGKTGAPLRVAVRYAAPRAMRVSIAACLVMRTPPSGARTPGDGVDAVLSAGDAELARATIIGGPQRLVARRVALTAGSVVDLSVGPNQRPGNDRFYYRMVIAAEPAVAQADCPAPPGVA